MADKQKVLSEIGDSIVILNNHLQSDAQSGVDNAHIPLIVQLTSTLALAYANIDHGAGQVIVTAGPAPNVGPVQPT